MPDEVQGMVRTLHRRQERDFAAEAQRESTRQAYLELLLPSQGWDNIKVQQGA